VNIQNSPECRRQGTPLSGGPPSPISDTAAQTDVVDSDLVHLVCQATDTTSGLTLRNNRAGSEDAILCSGSCK
jgi:hypothetical protein